MPAPFPGAAGSIPITGFMSKAVTSSVAITTLTLGTASSDVPTTPTLMNFHAVSGAGIGYIAPFGGTASATNGIPVEGGVTISIVLANPSLATVFASSSTTISAWW